MDKEAREKIEQELTEFAEMIYNFRDAMTIRNIKENMRSFLLANHLKPIPKDKPPVLSDEEILQIYHHLPDAETDAEMAMLGGEAVAQAQREADIKHYEGL